MAEKVCPNWGFPLGDDDRDICPECGFIFSSNQPSTSTPISSPTINQPTAFSTDWAQYVYECGVIAWKAFKKSFCFTGRASRREYWSYVITLEISVITWYLLGNSLSELYSDDYFSSLQFLSFLILSIAADIRRLHDCGKSGWWCLCPIANVFLYLKTSDIGVNKYGNPNPAKDLL